MLLLYGIETSDYFKYLLIMFEEISGPKKIVHNMIMNNVNQGRPENLLQQNIICTFPEHSILCWAAYYIHFPSSFFFFRICIYTFLYASSEMWLGNILISHFQVPVQICLHFHMISFLSLCCKFLPDCQTILCMPNALVRLHCRTSAVSLRGMSEEFSS